MVGYRKIVDAAFKGLEVEAAFKGSDVESKRGSAFLVLYRTASQLDQLREDLARGARDMAGRFARYEQECAERELLSAPPTGWSTLPEMTANHVQYETAVRIFNDTFELLSGMTVKVARAAAEKAS
jgi:hypothetical protein